jgi:Ca2+-binding RTX toxin-like protein
MITVKALKGMAESPRPTREDYVLREQDKPSYIPYAVLVALTGFAVFLKSFLPTKLEVASKRSKQEEAGEQASVVADSGGPAADSSAPDAKERDDAKDSSDNIVPLAPRKSLALEAVSNFLASDSPSIDFSRGGPIGLSDQGRASNDNQAAGPPRLASRPDGEAASRSGGGGGGGGGSGDDSGLPPIDPRRDGGLPPIDPTLAALAREGHELSRNRAPKINGAVRLQDLVGCNVYLITLLALLGGASDADGDQLRVVDLSVSSGTLTPLAGGDWRFTPDPGLLGEVTLKYRITDGREFVEQEAHFSVVEAPPVVGTDADDILLGTACGELVDGGAGDDNIDARAGADTVLGGDGDDHIVAGAGNDIVHAGAGNDVVLAGSGNDIVFGGSGNDRLFGDDGDDLLAGEQGDDFLSGGTGGDILLGGAGDDTLHGDAGNDKLDGGDGDDSLQGDTGHDTLVAGSGDDDLQGDEGNDVLSDGDGSDVVSGGEGDDHVIAAADGTEDTYSGDGGDDTLDYSTVTLNIVVDVGEGAAEGLEIGRDLIAEFEKIIGGQGDDRIIARDAAATMTGGDGDDTFEFHRSDDDHQPELVRKITDFTVGDRIVAASYEIRYREGEDGSEEVGDLFDDIYLSETGEQLPVKFRFEQGETGDRTFVEVHDRADPEDFYSIELTGRHDLEFIVAVTPQQENTI